MNIKSLFSYFGKVLNRSYINWKRFLIRAYKNFGPI